jgi:ribonucleoside-diphosphate reductase alpha chain
MRERLPDTRPSINHKVVLRHAKESKVKRIHFYLIAGMYEDKRPAELFVTVNKGNGMIAGFLKVIAILISLCLQYGVPFMKIYEKLAYQDFEPKGFTENKAIHSCTSIVDYIMQWMKQQFMSEPVVQVSEKSIHISDDNIASEELAHDIHLSVPVAPEQ